MGPDRGALHGIGVIAKVATPVDSEGANSGLHGERMSTTDFEAAQSTQSSQPSREATGSGAWRFAAQLLARADVRLNGTRAWDMRIHDPQVPERVVALGNLGLGEAYMDDQWDCDQLDEFFAHVLRAHLDDQIDPARLVFHALKARLMNRQTVRRAWKVGQQHYDIANAFYEAMLDKRMTYTCGYWSSGAKTLDEAQEA